MVDAPTHTTTPEPAWWTVFETATYLRVTERHVRQLIAEHKLPAFKIGTKAIRIRPRDVEALLLPVGGSAA